MWLHFTYRYTHGKKRNFRLFSADLENLMETLNYFVCSGCQLLSASLVDAEGGRTVLPVEVFDGKAVASGMQGLQTDYHTLCSSLDLKSVE